MTPLIARQRLVQQGLTGAPLETPAEVVGWLGAVQAQDYAGALWSLGLRTLDATERSVEQAFADGAILRTHVLRPTWHFVAPADIRWLLALTAPRVKATLAYNDRQWGLDAALIARCNHVISGALQGEQWRTRAELGAALAEVGIVAESYRLGQLMIHAELDGIVCSGPRRGKQFTYALLDERVPPVPALPREQALAGLTRRYYTGHGPATLQDFVWWSGLTVADAKAGLAEVGNLLDSTEVAGQRFWFTPALRAEAARETAMLLPTFDEFLVGFAAFDQMRRGGPDATGELMFESTIVLGGQVIGSWKRTLRKGHVAVELAPFTRFTDTQLAAVEAATARYGAFLGLPVEMKVVV